MSNDDEITVRLTYTPPVGGGKPIIFESTTDMGISLIHGMTGFGIAPVELTYSDRAQSHGAVLQGVHLEKRELFVPLLMDAETVNDLDVLRDSLVERLNPLLGEGTLTVERIADGQIRSAKVIYKKGLEGDYGDGYHGVWETFGLTFSMGEAFWNGPETTAQWSLLNKNKPFISDTVSFFPIIVGKSHVNNAYTVDIVGDAPAHPVWTITGPATDIIITNTVTKQKIQINGEVKAGESITIDTINNTLTGTNRTENDLWDALSLDSTLFPLAKGKNKISAVATGLTSESKITAVYRQQFNKGY